MKAPIKEKDSQMEENVAERKNLFLELDNAHNPLATDTTNLKKNK